MNKNRLTLSLLSLMVGATSLAHAGEMATASNLPFDSNTGFEVTASVLFLQPAGTNLDYAILGFPLPVNSPHWNTETINPSYSTGFNVGARYGFRNTENDVRLDWTHLNTSDSDAAYAGTSEFVVPFNQVGPSLGQQLNPATQQAHATAKFNYDVVNLDAGEYVDYGKHTQLRFFAGLSGAQLKEQLTTSFQDNGATFQFSSINNSKFTGMGPLFGIDGIYTLPRGFGVIGKIAGSALIGGSEPSTLYSSSSPQLAAAGVSVNHQSINSPTTTQVVPSLDGKLGLDYAYSFGKDLVFTIAAGYQAATYFNALVSYNPSSLFGEINLGTVAVSTMEKSVSNFSVNGPFIDFSLKFS